ncbi:aminopeptidase N [Nocardioides sp.]|uniref:aminopeptidase N n=1 Tax=Nocardioides sp. TaxID=35761 RepID=UPI002736125B|nr:aminopeptidase N [Nocardioides sp.]MDP3893948.1 aminopeptidase N [Nocardioides sp.]
MTTTSQSLRRSEALERREQLAVSAYDVHLDLSTDTETFRSVTTISFTSSGGPTFCDLKPHAVNTIRLNDEPVDPATLDRGRLPLKTAAGENRLVVDAVMAFRTDGEGLHRSTDPADGRDYVYGMSFLDAAPSIFACFDQPDLKAPYTLHVRAPREWKVFANAPGTQVEPGEWEFAPTPPLSTYFVTLVAGPYHLITDEHDGIPLGLSSRQSLARHLDADADELLTLTRQCFDEFHRLFGIRYPFGNYHQAFVPEFNAGAMENPGCVTFRDPLVFSSRVTRGERIKRATTVAHEMAHQWFGNITTPAWWDDLWLNESFAEYMGNRVTADVTEYADAWTHNAYVRRQWGLVADQRPSTHPVAGNGAQDAASALQDFDGISYTKGSSILKQLNTTVGDPVFLEGVVDHLTRHRFDNATMHDLFASWERALQGSTTSPAPGAPADLSGFTQQWLRTAGPDTLRLDRDDGIVRRDPPTAHPADRSHTLRAAVAAPGGGWTLEDLVVTSEHTPLAVPTGAAVVLDPYEETWALTLPDPVTVAALPGLMQETTDPLLRAAIWNTVRSAFHNTTITPGAVLDLLEATVPRESSDDALGSVLVWVVRKVAPLAAAPEQALARVRNACRARLADAPPGSTVQLATFQALVMATVDADELRRWLSRTALPEGLGVDLDLRWRLLVRLACLGGITRRELADQLAAEPTAVAAVEHARALASLPDDEAKAWAWDHFTGSRPAPNYEIEATGHGMWQSGQEDLTEPYVERYFAELPASTEHFSGWLLADVAEAFFPVTSLDDATHARALDLAASTELDAALRRRLVDAADELSRRMAVRRLGHGG